MREEQKTMAKNFEKLNIANNYVNDYVNNLEEEKPGKEVKKEVIKKPKVKKETKTAKAMGRKPGAQVFKVRKQAPSYKIVTIRFKEDEYNEIYNKIIKKYSNDYASLTDFIKGAIQDKLNK